MSYPLRAAIFATAFVTFAQAQDLAPDSISGLTVDAVILGSSLLSQPGSGGYELSIGTTTLTQTYFTVGATPKQFSYSYRKTGTKTAAVSLTDTSTGTVWSTLLHFETSSRASFTFSAPSSLINTQTGKWVFEYPPSPASAGTTSRLVNISTLGTVSPGAPLTAGFVVSGTTSKTILIRAIGPTLTQFGVTGVLENPRLILLDSAGHPIADNDDWGTSTSSGSDVFSKAGAFALDITSRDASLVTTLSTGNYTAQVVASDDPITASAPKTGQALVEVYEVP